MDVPVDATVECTDGPCGRSTYAIVDPAKERVTHVVIEESGLSGRERLVPVNLISESTPEMIRLRCSAEELQGMQAFVKREYLPGEEPFLMYPPGHYMVWPADISGGVPPVIEHNDVPAGELAISRGARVEASDGKVGQVDEFLTDPVGQQITHLVLRQGHLWGQREVTVPANQIDRIEDGVVYLKLDKKGIEALPGTKH
jgi:sporulation protein YlmC with PRC-barrel domain